MKGQDCREASFCCCHGRSTWFSTVLLKYARHSLKETLSGWEHMLLSMHSSALIVLFQMRKLPTPQALIQPHNHQKYRLLNCLLITSSMVPFLYSLQDTANYCLWFPQRISNYGSSDHRTILLFCLRPGVFKVLKMQ